MKTKAVRLYGKKDLRLDTFDLPEIKDDEILAEIQSDSLCMSSYKASIQGSEHKRVPDDIATNPVIIGHEFSGTLLQVGKKWQNKYKAGDKFSIQPALNYKGTLDAPGYSYRFIGGDATHVIIPNEVMEMNCLLQYTGKGFFPASLSEPMSCIVGAFHANYHTKGGSYVHDMGIKKDGSVIILAGGGPMGLGAIDYAIHCDRQPSLLVVTEIDQARLDRAKSLFPESEAAKNGVKLHYVNTSLPETGEDYLRKLTDDKGYDDVFVFAPVAPVVEMADRLLGHDGCLNFFAGPSKADFKAAFNFYNVHYAATHVVGTSGGNTDDMVESLKLMSEGRINPAVMITHIGGLNAVPETTLHLPEIPGGKKLIYTHVSLPLTAIDKFREFAKTDSRFAKLADITDRNQGLWSIEAEEFLLQNFKDKE
ncbi:MAG: zinc-binding dehydrogenase [Fibrobacteres bacterium]|nr:zinc-binding dehydrogenase [Fibrobacterota bacterium]